MIKPLNLELKIILYIITYGIYYYAVSDLVIFIEEKHKLKKIQKLFLELIYLISQIYITYRFCYRLDDGYIPIYFLLFIVIGFLLYYLLMKDGFNFIIKKIDFLIIKIVPKIKHLFYSPSIVKLIKNKVKNILQKSKNKKLKKKVSKNQNTWHAYSNLV